ncbi:MFS transporter [Achromobacter xylosoxidans]
MPSLSPAFRRLASSNLAAQFSEQIALAAAPLAAVLALGADAAQTGYLQTAQTLPFLLLSLPAGVLADRMQRRLLMSAAECARAVSLLCLLALLWSGQLTLPLLAALGFLGAVGTVAYNVAAPALVPRLLRPSWPAPTAGWSWRAAPPSRPGRPPAARWSARWARPPPTRWRPRCRCWPPCCWRDCR